MEIKDERMSLSSLIFLLPVPVLSVREASLGFSFLTVFCRDNFQVTNGRNLSFLRFLRPLFVNVGKREAIVGK